MDDDGRAPLPVTASWRRSKLWGLRPETAAPQPGTRADVVTKNGRLKAASAPVIARLRETLADTPVTLVLGDRHGDVVHFLCGTASMQTRLHRRGVDVGARLAEDVAGNNGVGTVLELRRGVHIRGTEHFADTFKDLSCYGHPIVNPLTSRLEGVVDITGLDRDGVRLFAPFARQVVADIEDNLVASAHLDDQQLWQRYVVRLRDAGRGARAVCAFGEEAVLASPQALEFLTHHDLMRLRQVAGDACARPRRGAAETTVEVALSLGSFAVRIEFVGRRGALLHVDLGPALGGPAAETGPTRTGLAQPDIAGAGRAGAALAGPEHASSDLVSPDAGPCGATSGRNARSAAGNEAVDNAASATTLAVVGPTGTGRTTRARELGGPGAEAVAVSAYRDSAAAWRRIAELLDAAPRVLLVDDVDLLTPGDLRRLAQRIRNVPSTTVILTSTEPAVDVSPELHAVLDGCAERETLLPLGRRGEQLSACIEAVAAELAAERGVPVPALTPRFVDAVAQLPLPAGFVSLRRVLADTLDRYVSGTAFGGPRGTASPAALDLVHLDPKSRAPGAAHRGGELARSEYEAVVRALAESGGNRSRAAQILGVSRTTLYARLREFRLG